MSLTIIFIPDIIARHFIHYLITRFNRNAEIAYYMPQATSTLVGHNFE